MATGFRDGNRLTLLKNGAEFFPALVEAIDTARLDVRIETYIFQDDAAGEAVRDALARAAQRGVTVRLLVDGIGSRTTAAPFFEPAERAGVCLLVFRPERARFRFDRSRMRRNHRKIALVDGKTGFIGGINIIDDLTESLSDHPRLDYAVRVEGPVLADMYMLVHSTWRWVAWRQWRRAEVGDRPVPVATEPVGTERARFVARDNFRHRRDIEHAYRAAILAARERILIACPYFLPGRAFGAALLAAARRGVTVTILLQGRADHPLLQMATRSLYSRLLAAGIHIAEYEKSMLHGKVASIDDRWATVGSSNLDPFSLLLNREANIIVEDAAFAIRLRQSVEAEMRDGARLCVPGDWAARSVWQRIRERAAYVFSRWVMGFMGLTRGWE